MGIRALRVCLFIYVFIYLLVFFFRAGEGGGAGCDLGFMLTSEVSV